MKNIVLQQKQELNYLLSLTYQKRKLFEDTAPFIDSNIIKLITGPRRAGKSVYALQMLDGKNIAYLNFDDSSLLEKFEENLIMQYLSEVYPNYTHLILDEIQNLEKWDIWVSKLKRRGVNLIIIGSNARMLSGEMATVLTGRYVEISIYPFSMAECMEYRKVNVHPQLPQEKAVLMTEVEGYLCIGGFPEITKTREIAKSYIGSLFDSIILKDVAQRHKIRKTQELYNLAEYLVYNYCNCLSYNNIAEDLGINSVNTVKKYCNYLAEPYLFFFLPRYNNKLKEMKKAPQKIYVVDNGFIYAKSFELSSNSGKRLENMVFIELLRRGYNLEKNLFYFRSRTDKEIDFVTREGNKVTSLIQVSYEISSGRSRERELKAFVEGAKELKCNKLLLITWNTKETIEYKGLTIQAIPITEWGL